MNRYGYSDYWDGSQEEQWALIRWRGAVESATRGKRGQKFLRELLDILDGMEVKELIEGDLEKDGQFCTLGVACHVKGIDTKEITALLGDYDPEWGYEGGDEEAYWDDLAHSLDIAPALAREIMFTNDEGVWGGTSKPKYWEGTDEDWDHHVGRIRWTVVRNWVAGKIQSHDEKGRRPDQRGSDGDTDVDPGTGTAGSAEASGEV